METWFYEVVSIDGDYANLRRTDIESNDLKLVARALLPAERNTPGFLGRQHVACSEYGA